MEKFQNIIVLIKLSFRSALEKKYKNCRYFILIIYNAPVSISRRPHCAFDPQRELDLLTNNADNIFSVSSEGFAIGIHKTNIRYFIIIVTHR
jgi:hypothetical protein